MGKPDVLEKVHKTPWDNTSFCSLLHGMGGKEGQEYSSLFLTHILPLFWLSPVPVFSLTHSCSCWLYCKTSKPHREVKFWPPPHFEEVATEDFSSCVIKAHSCKPDPIRSCGVAVLLSARLILPSPEQTNHWYGAASESWAVTAKLSPVAHANPTARLLNNWSVSQHRRQCRAPLSPAWYEKLKKAKQTNCHQQSNLSWAAPRENKWKSWNCNTAHRNWFSSPDVSMLPFGGQWIHWEFWIVYCDLNWWQSRKSPCLSLPVHNASRGFLCDSFWGGTHNVVHLWESRFCSLSQ